MSEDKITQPATADADATAKPETEAEGAPENTKDDFDAALDEFTKTTDKPSSEQQKPKPTATPDADLKAEVQALRQEQNQRIFREDMNRLVNQVRGEFASDEVDSEFIEAWIEAQARKEPRLAQAWIQRDDDPAKFARVASSLKQKFAEKHGRLRKQDQDATDTREVVTDAVRRGSKPAPAGQAPNYSGMTDAQFREAVKKDHGFTPL